MKAMKKISNLFTSVVVAAIILCQSMTCAYAAMNVPIQIKCDKNITLQDSDTFTISYYNMDDESETITSVQINAKQSGSIPVNDGTYRIKSISYNGTNQSISKSYGITGDFSAYSDLNETSTLLLAIGSDPCKELEGEYDPTAAAATYNVIMDSNHDENGQPKEGYTPGLDDEIIPDEPTAATDQDTQTVEDKESDLEELDKEILGEKDETQPRNVGSGEEAVVEHYENDNEGTHSSSILIRLLPLGIVFVIVMLCVYIAYKKKMI